MNTLGIDLSLTGTGIVFLKKDGTFKDTLIKSKPVGSKPVNELKRILKIVDGVSDVIASSSADLVAIEGMIFGMTKTQAIIQLAGLNYIIRALLHSNDIPFIVVAPSTLKKFTTGKGNTPKDIMMLETYQRYKVSITNNNICDAFNLAQCAMAVLGKPTKKLTKPQEEVVNLIKKQL